MKDINRQQKAPLYRAMENYAEGGAKAYHTPGHKQGLGAPEDLKRMVTDLGLRMEVSLMEELDDIHDAATCIKEAQDLAAELYGAKATNFFVNGTTGAIHAMLLTGLNPGDKVLVPRNAHRSVWGGLVLVGAEPIFIQPEIDEDLGIAMNITVETVSKAIAEHPEAKALVMVHPNYYGVASDIKSIAQVVHEHNMVLLVDEAHGPHLKFHSELPISAIEAGADIVAQSTHKLLGSMTQSSMIHFNSDRLSEVKFQKMCSLVQSTSPNYLLMGSLDLARQQMALEGEKRWGKAIKLAEELRAYLNTVPGLSCLGREKLGTSGRYDLDPTKITVSMKGLGLTGAEAEQILRHKFNIQCELSDAYNVLFLLSYADEEEKFDYLAKALTELARDYKQHKVIQSFTGGLPSIPEMKVSPRESSFMTSSTKEFSKSGGAIAGEMLSFYPPGIPLIYPGEEITQELIDYITWRLSTGGNLSGAYDHSLKNIQVLEV